MKKLFSTPEVWVVLITFFVMVMGVFIPGYALDIPHLAALGALTFAYVCALAISPATFNWGSRKFWLTVVTMAGVILDSFHVFPGSLDVATLSAAIAAVAVYVIALAKDPGAGWAGTLVSRKFWGFVLTIGVVCMRAFSWELPAGITVEQMVALIVGPIALILKAGFGMEPTPIDPEIIDDTGSQAGAG